jgi:hypothetical protein
MVFIVFISPSSTLKQATAINTQFSLYHFQLSFHSTSYLTHVAEESPSAKPVIKATKVRILLLNLWLKQTTSIYTQFSLSFPVILSFNISYLTHVAEESPLTKSVI